MASAASSSSVKVLIARSTDLTPDALSERAGQPVGRLLKLLHPKYGVPFVVLHTGDRFLELQSSKLRKYSSWFVNQRVVSDGSVLMASPVDPRFLLLPLLERSTSAGSFQPLDQLVVTPPDCDRLPLDKASEWQLGQICDVNDRLGPDMVLVRVNNDKVLEWLHSKVQRLATAIHNKRRSRRAVDNFASGFTLTSSNVAVAPAAATPESFEPTREDRRIALQIVAEYISESWLDKLLSKCGLTAPDLVNTGSNKRLSSWEQELKQEQESSAYVTGASADPTRSNGATAAGSDNGAATKRQKTAPKATGKAANAKNAAAAAGAKSITSFFGKKA